MAKDEILEKKSVEGHFECIIRDRHGEIIERFSQHNLIPLTAYKQFLSIIAGDKKSSLSKFILGTDGVKANGEPKGEDEGFNLAIQDLFSIRNSKPHYITSWSKGDNTAQNITNIDTSAINSSSTNEETEQPKVELYFDNSSSRVYFKYHLPLSCGNLTDNTRTTAYSEAGLYIDDKLFAMKTFKALTKSYNKTMDIIWSFKTVGDSADGIEFRVDTSKLNSDIFTLPMKPNTHPLIIEWGDGTEETVIEAGLGNKALDNYKHKYDAKGEFSIRILTQGIPNFDFTDLHESVKHSLVSIDSVTSPFQDNTFNSMFEGCISLRSIPYSLFRYNTNATSFNSTFKGCENLAGIPSNLFISNNSITSAISTFEGCSKAYIPLSVFPKTFIDLFKEDLSLVENLWLGTIPSLEFTIKVDTPIFTLPFDRELGIPAAMVVNYGEDGSYKYYDIQSEDLNFTYTDNKIGRKVKISVYTSALPKFKFVKGVNASSIIEVGRTKESFISTNFKNLSGMFKDCINLEKVNIDLFSRNSQLEDVSSMFENCYKLKYASFIENKFIKNFTKTWYNCYSMTIDENILNYKCVQEDTKFGYMCYRDKIEEGIEAGIAPMIWTEEFIGSDEDELAFGGAGNINLRNYDSIPDLMKHTFMAIKVDIHKLDIDLKLNYNRLVSWGDHTSSRGGRHIYNKLGEYIIKIYGVQTIEEWNSLGSDLPHIVKEILNIGDIQLPTTHTFEGFYKLTKVPEQIFIKLIKDTTSFAYAFAGCESLTSVPDFIGVTDKLTNINRMFDGCMKLQAIPNGLLNAPGIETMEFCFRDCDSLTEITGQLQSTKLKSVQGMFYECSNITSIPANFFGNTVNTITNYASMFFRCKQLIIPEGLLAGFENTPMTNINIDNMFNLSRIFESSQIEGGSIAPEVLWSSGYDKFNSYESVFSPGQVWSNEADIPENLMFGEIDFDTYFIEFNPFKAAFEQDGSEAALTSEQIEAITGKMSKQKMQLGYSGQLNSNQFNLYGFNFKAWGEYTGNREYANESNILVNYVDSTKVFKLGALWQRALKRILFNINGGTIASGRESEFTPEVNIGIGLPFTFYSADLFTKQWHDLVAWNTTLEGDGDSFNPGQEYIMEEGNIDLYAIWQQWEKTLVFNANNENVLNAMQNQTRVVGTEVQMPLNEFVVPRGYIFRSWNTSNDGSGTEYQEGQNTTFDNKDELNLYAIWDESVDITFESNGGSGSQEKQTIRKNTEFTIPTETTFIAPNGKTFSGFTLRSDITDVTVTNGKIIATKDIILVANWSN